MVIHSFNGRDGERPSAELLRRPNGAIYCVATTSENGLGTVVELDPPTGGSTHWRETVLHQFSSSDGSNPSRALVFGAGGSLYGTTLGGGTVDGVALAGTVYSLTPPAAAGTSAGWTYAILYRFPSGTGGNMPLGTLAVSSNGTLFGVTEFGGRGVGQCYGCGTVFSLTPPAEAGGAWTERLLYSFNPPIGDGYHPFAGVVLAPTGVLYGTTLNGGSGSLGTIYSLTPPEEPGTPPVEAVLHSFARGSDGTSPESGLALGPKGERYGATFYGGDSNNGTVFKLTPPSSPGGNWTEAILHSFTAGVDGGGPNGVVLGSDGTLYGTTRTGGASAEGTVFALTP